jgi:predicted HTH domain antitoxin
LDKSKVISAYRKGLLSLQECAQILGLELCPMERCVEQWKYDREFRQQYERSYMQLLASRDPAVWDTLDLDASRKYPF